MKEFDVFEKNMKEALGGLEETKPSKALWFKISSSLLFLSIFKSAYFKVIMIAVVSTVGITWFISSSNAKEINSSSIVRNSSDIAIKKSAYTIEVATIEKTTLFNNDNSKEQTIKNSIDETYSIEPNSQIVVVNNNEIEAKLNSSNSATTEGNKKNENENLLAVSPSKTDSKPVTNNKIRVIKTGNIVNDNYEENTIVSKDILKNNDKETTTATSLYDMDDEIVIMPIRKFNYEPNMVEIDNATHSNIRPIKPMKKRIGFNYDAFAGFDIDNSIISLAPNDIAENDLNKNSIMYSYNFGGNINIYRNKWFMRLGINYNQYSEEYNAKSSVLKVDEYTSTYFLIHREYTQTLTGWSIQGNDTIPIYSQTVVETLEEKTSTKYDTTITANNYLYRNNYSFVNIPITFGREFEYKSFIFDVAVGVSLTRVMKNNASIFDAESGNIISTNAVSPISKKNIFNGVLSIDAGYKFGNKLIFIRPELYTHLNSIFDNTYLQEHKMYQYRISAGIRFTIQ